MFNYFVLIATFQDKMEKYCGAGLDIDNIIGACALYAGYLKQETNSEYEVIIRFPLQQWLSKSPSMLRYM
jgi:hypothetical protein